MWECPLFLRPFPVVCSEIAPVKNIDLFANLYAAVGLFGNRFLARFARFAFENLRYSSFEYASVKELFRSHRSGRILKWDISDLGSLIELSGSNLRLLGESRLLRRNEQY